MGENRLKKVAVLDSEVQAQALGVVLEDRGIPHLLRSYHDSAYAGLFQGMQGWGCVEAEECHQAEILEVLEDLKRSSLS